MYRAYQRGGKLLMLGVDYESSTYCHLVEAMVWRRQRALDSDVPFSHLDRPTLGVFWDGLGRMRRGLVGASDCRLFSIADFVDTLFAEVEPDPTPHRLVG